MVWLGGGKAAKVLKKNSYYFRLCKSDLLWFCAGSRNKKHAPSRIWALFGHLDGLIHRKNGERCEYMMTMKSAQRRLSKWTVIPWLLIYSLSIWISPKKKKKSREKKKNMPCIKTLKDLTILLKNCLQCQ